jgi:hypothetical protein
VDQLDPGSPPQGTEDQAADASEAVDADFHGRGSGSAILRNHRSTTVDGLGVPHHMAIAVEPSGGRLNDAFSPCQPILLSPRSWSQVGHRQDGELQLLRYLLEVKVAGEAGEKKEDQHGYMTPQPIKCDDR